MRIAYLHAIRDCPSIFPRIIRLSIKEVIGTGSKVSAMLK